MSAVTLRSIPIGLFAALIDPDVSLTESISIVIPTFGRDRVLTDTLDALIRLQHRAAEILVVDQSQTHDSETIERLTTWHQSSDIRWIRLPEPSITRSMNHGLRKANSPLVLFLDDDIRPRGEIVRVHAEARRQHPDLWATVGQVIQPWQQAADLPAPRSLTGLRLDDDFPFHSTRDAVVHNVMAGNLCVDRERALSIGGFDENFQGAAYRFETEFSRRVECAGGGIRFLGSAGIDHLRVAKGGTRSAGSHLASASPGHGIGDHYYALLHGGSWWRSNVYCARRMIREVRTRFHLTHPWWIPVKLFGELRAYRGARRLAAGKRERVVAVA